MMKTRYFKSVTVFSLLLAATVAIVATISADTTAEAQTDTTPPTVTGTSPEDGKTKVDRDKSIEVKFSEAMDPSSINTNSVELVWFDSACTWSCSDGNKVLATVEYNPDTHTATLNPTHRLAKKRLYYVAVWSCSGCDYNVRDLAGNELEFTYTFSFKTGRK